MDRIEPDTAVAVRRCKKRDQAEQYALVLTAMGIPSLIGPDGRATVVWVTPADAATARKELSAYDAENIKPRVMAARPHLPLPKLDIAFVYWAVLLFFFAAARQDAFSIDWAREGSAQVGLMRNGEWWRAVTAMCLHINTPHLLGNLVFGTVFMLLLAQVTGAGVAALSMVVAGTAGNVISALVQTPAHTSIGASTAVFAALGVLAALRQFSEADDTDTSMRKWLPVAGGLGLLAFLGFSGERTDILAHILGFGCGVAAGWILAKHGKNWSSDQSVQWTCAGTAAAIIVIAWVIAVTV